MHRRAFMSLVGGAAAMWPLTARAQRPAMRVISFFGAYPPAPLYLTASKETVMAEKGVSIAYADGTGSFLVLLAMAEQQGLFEKYGVDVRSVAIKGATVPRLTADVPLGMIGEPAALLQAAGGADLRLVASFSDIKLSGHLVARPGINSGRFARQAPRCARDWCRVMDINDSCPRTIGARSTTRRNHHFAGRQSGLNLPGFGTGRDRWCAGVSRAKSRTTGEGVCCTLERLSAKHKQLWRGARCFKRLSVEQSRCGCEGGARTSGSPRDLPWRTE